MCIGKWYRGRVKGKRSEERDKVGGGEEEGEVRRMEVMADYLLLYTNLFVFIYRLLFV